ncbi:FxLD family lanthipeptide [Streptomyces sp. NPDC002082]|uniref:FxLD family lanthipeptide n=1 Tax=Streptomyces sp. NPDC002082 TaxID=3154772 RepID=UPI00331C43B8
MTHQIEQATTNLGDFSLDLRVVEAAAPIANLLRATDDGCGSSCGGSNTACTSFTGDPS